MVQSDAKRIQFAGVDSKLPSLTAKTKSRLEKRKEREKEATTLSKKKRAAKKAASAKTKEARS